MARGLTKQETEKEGSPHQKATIANHYYSENSVIWLLKKQRTDITTTFSIWQVNMIKFPELSLI